MFKRVINGFRMLVLVVGMAGLMPLTCLADDNLALWNRAQTQNARLAQLFAKRVKTRSDMYNGKGAPMASSEDVDVFKELKGGIPIRVRQSHTSSSGRGLNLPDLPVDVMDHPESGLRKADKVRPAGEEVVFGWKCRVFDIEGVDEDRTPFSGRAWIEAESARPVKVEYVVDVAHGPSTIKALKALSYSVVYDAESRPVKVSLDLTVSLLFARFRTVMQQELSDWASRPERQR